MQKLDYTFEDVQFSPQISFKSRATRAAGISASCSEEDSKTEANKGSQCYQSGGAGIGFIDPSTMATGRGIMRSIAERAYVAYREANDTGIAQLASGVSGNDVGGHERQSDTAS